MNAKEAVAKRITELCSERKMTVNAVANMAGISPSSIYSMFNYKIQNPGVVSLHKICYGFVITLRDFLTPTFLMMSNLRTINCEINAHRYLIQLVRGIFLGRFLGGKAQGSVSYIV